MGFEDESRNEGRVELLTRRNAGGVPYTRTAEVEWIGRHPRYERELTEFTVNWSLSDPLPTAPEVQTIAADTLVQRRMARVHEALAWQGAPAVVQAKPAMAGLTP